jgi:hypothetical protein
MVARTSTCLRRLAGGRRSGIVGFSHFLAKPCVTVEALLDDFRDLLQRTGRKTLDRPAKSSDLAVKRNATWGMPVQMTDDAGTCEVKVKGEWITRTIDEALRLHRDRELRCSECHGRVRAHHQAQDGSMKAHFEHFQRHEGCSRSWCFGGTRFVHPKALR